jgi:Flp pilus assembly protein CpaB
MTYRVRNIGIAVALAAVAALMTSFYVTNYKRHVQRGEDHVTVLVAKHDIPAGTAGSDVADDLSATEVPRRSVVPGAISNPDEIKDKFASQQTFAGEQVTTNRFSSVSETGIHGQLRGTLRAYQIKGDQYQTLAGTLRTGDHVDLVAAFSVKNKSRDPVLSRVVLRNLKVLQAPSAPAVGSKLTSGGTGQDFPMILRMTDSQAQKFELVLALTQNGANGVTWHLALRPVVDSADSHDHLDSPRTVLGDGIAAAERRAFFGGKR